MTLAKWRLALETFGNKDMQHQASLLQEAAMKHPVIITERDRPRLVLMSMAEFDRLRGRQGKAAALTALPEPVAAQIDALAEDQPAVKPTHGS